MLIVGLVDKLEVEVIVFLYSRTSFLRVQFVMVRLRSGVMYLALS